MRGTFKGLVNETEVFTTTCIGCRAQGFHDRRRRTYLCCASESGPMPSPRSGYWLRLRHDQAWSTVAINDR